MGDLRQSDAQVECAWIDGVNKVSHFWPVSICLQESGGSVMWIVRSMVLESANPSLYRSPACLEPAVLIH